MQSERRALDGVEPHSAQTDYESGPRNAVQVTKIFEMMGGFEMTSVKSQSGHLMIESCRP